MIKNKFVVPAACLSLLLSCHPTTPLATTSPPLPAMGIFTKEIDKFEGTALITTQAATDKVSFQLRGRSRWQLTALNLNQIRYLRLWVRGTGITDRIWNEGGFVPVDLSQGAVQTISISGIPKGRNRIVFAQAYDGSQQPLPGILLSAIYHSPETKNTVQVYLKWRYVPVGKILDQLLQQAPQFIDAVDTNALQALLDKLMYGTTENTTTFVTHPSRLVVDTISQDLIQAGGQVPAVPPTSWVAKNNSVDLYVRTPDNQIFSQPVHLTVMDPASTTVTIPGGQDHQTLSNIAPGTWPVVATHSASNQVTVQGSISVSPNGTYQLVTGTAGNPLLLPPVVTSLTGPFPLTQPYAFSHWRADNTSKDSESRHDGQLLNGATLVPGMFGKAMRMNGFSDDGIGGNDSRFSINPSPAELRFLSSLSLSVWFKPETPLPVDPSGAILRNGLGTDLVYALLYNASTQSITFHWFDTAFKGISTPANTVIPSHWNHLVATRSNTNQIKIYLNGVLQQDQAGTASIPAAATFNIGNAQPGNGGQVFKGLIDETQVFATELSAATIEAMYKGRKLTLAGDGFSATPANNVVTVNGVTAPVIGATATQLTVTIPPEAYGQSGVQVRVNNLSSNSVVLPMAPQISHIHPPTASSGQTVVLSGNAFMPGDTQNTVRFNGIPATVQNVTTHQLTVTVPPGVTSGSVTVNTEGGTGHFTQFYAYPLAGLLTWWAGENNAIDSVNSLNGNLLNGATFAAGKQGQAFSFDGVDDCVEVADTALLRPAQVSLEAWVYPQNAGVLAGLVSKEPPPAVVQNGYGFRQRSDNRFWFVLGREGAGAFTASTTLLAANQWYHLVGTYDGANINLYVNGKLESTTPVGAVAIDSLSPIRMGRLNSDIEPFNGKLDEVRVYNRALSEREVNALFQISR